MAGATAQSVGYAAWGAISTPYRLFAESIPEFFHAGRERLEGKDRAWDVLFTAGNLIGDVTGTYTMGEGAINTAGRQLGTAGEFSVPPEMTPPSATGGWELWTNPRHRAFYDPTALDNIPHDTVAYDAETWRAFLEGKYGQENVSYKIRMPNQEAEAVMGQVKEMMMQEKYTETDLVQLNDLINQDIKNFEVYQHWQKSTSVGGQYIPSHGKPGILKRTEGVSDIDNLGHEWIHFDEHRQRGWQEGTVPDGLREEIKAHQWQLDHAEEFDYGIYSIDHHEMMIKHYKERLKAWEDTE